MSLKIWLHGLGAAAIGGGANAMTVIILDPLKFNLQDGWKNLMMAVFVSGMLSAAFYLKTSPLPPDDPPKPPKSRFSKTGGIKIGLLFLSLLSLTGCTTLQTNVTESKAQAASDYIKERSGLIENGVAGLIQIAITEIPKGVDKQHYINIVHGVASRLNALLVDGRFDALSIREAFKVEDPAISASVVIAGELLIAEMNHLRKNGYADFAAALLISASKGISDGSA